MLYFKKFRSFGFSFLACRGDKNKVEEEITTKSLTNFQQNNMRVCDCRSPDSESITGYLKSCEKLIRLETPTCLSHL